MSASLRAYVSPDLPGSEYGAKSSISTLLSAGNFVQDARPHLSSSMRSFRSEKVSAFVKALLDCDESAARETLREVVTRYPIVATRDLARAKQWVRDQARGSEQYGLVVASRSGVILTITGTPSRLGFPNVGGIAPAFAAVVALTTLAELSNVAAFMASDRPAR